MSAAAPLGGPTLRPSGWWYALPAVGLVVAGILGLEVLRDGWRDARQVFLRASVAAPGEDQVLTIDEPGGYTIGYVGNDLLAGDDDKERLAEALAIQVLPAGGSESLPVLRYDGFQELTNPADGSQYVPLRTVRFDRTGDYLLRTRAQPRLDPERTVLVVTQSPYRKIADALRTAVLLEVVAVFLAVLVTVILARARGRSRRAARASAPAWAVPLGRPVPGWGPHQPGASGWGPPGDRRW